MTQENTGRLLQGLSNELAGVVAVVAPSIVRVDDGSRLTATGLIWSADGLIVTTSHGVERDENVTVVQADGTALSAVIVGRDSDTDVALLRVQAADLPAIVPATEDEVRVGNLALVLARPGHTGLQATLGILSARLDSQNNGQDEYVLHTDALLYPGFSGGALVTMNGHVAGMTNLLFGRGKGVALGLPVVANVVRNLLTNGSTQRGFLGVSTQQVLIPAALQQSLQRTQTSGLLIVQVELGSGAEQAGLYLGDVLLALNGETISDVDTLRKHLRQLHAGQTADVQILRAGELRDLQVTLSGQK